MGGDNKVGGNNEVKVSWSDALEVVSPCPSKFIEFPVNRPGVGTSRGIAVSAVVLSPHSTAG